MPMPLLRGRRDDGGTKYRMREKLFAIGDDFWIEDADGERAFKVDGKALRFRDTLVLEDRSGNELLKVQERSSTFETRWTSRVAAERSRPSRRRSSRRCANASRSRSQTARTWRRRGTS